MRFFFWTKEIVGNGKKAGLAFGEDRRKRGVEKDPLPALFLHEMAYPNVYGLLVFLKFVRASRHRPECFGGG